MLDQCVLVVLIVVSHFVLTSEGSLTYGCYPNGTLTVENPDPDKFVHATAVDFEMIGNNDKETSDLKCGLSWLDGKTKILIQQNEDGNCKRGQYIQLTLSNTELPGVIIVKPEQETESYRVRCSKVPEEGITVTVVQEFNPILALFDLPPDMVDPGVLPNFEGSIHSAMRLCCEHRTNLPIFSADVGSHILWTLDVYHEFYLLPLQCNAYAGLSTSGSPMIELYKNGCSMEKSLTDYRLTDSFNNMRMYVMDFYVFHFYTSDFLTIECDVRICGPDNEETCSWETECDERKKRAIRGDEMSSKRRDVTTTTRMTLQVFGGLSKANTIVSMDTRVLGLILFFPALLVKI